jgi:hypothetical protein
MTVFYSLFRAEVALAEERARLARLAAMPPAQVYETRTPAWRARIAGMLVAVACGLASPAGPATPGGRAEARRPSTQTWR